MTWRAYTDLTGAQLRLHFLLGQKPLTERSRNTERRLHQTLACIVQNLNRQDLRTRPWKYQRRAE